MQTCLEKRSMDARHEQQTRSDYNRENQYDVTHPDALANGDKRGKGTGHPGGTKNLIPNCDGPKGIIDYSNFDTGINSGAGNNVDNDSRKKMLTRSLFNENKVYSAELVNTSANLSEGQYNTY